MNIRRACLLFTMLNATAVCADDLVDRADANGDGFVSLYELRAAHYADEEFNRRIEASFASYDSDGDGLISEAELRARRVAPAAVAVPLQRETQVDSVPAEPASAPDPAQTTIAQPAEENIRPPESGGEAARLSRSESMLLAVDADNSGGASNAELIASGSGEQWFTDRSFEAADRDGDKELDSAELELLLQSMERRRR